MPSLLTVNTILIFGGMFCTIGAFLFYMRGGGRKTAITTIELLKEQVHALSLKLDLLTEEQAHAQLEMARLRERNVQLTELVTSAGAIERLITQVTEDRVLQREERHRILNQISALATMSELLYDRLYGELPERRRSLTHDVATGTQYSGPERRSRQGVPPPSDVL